MELYSLQNIIFGKDDINNIDMYSTIKKILFSEGDCVNTASVLSFDTYFNMFSLKKWNHYTNIEDIYLKICLKSSNGCKIRIYAYYRNDTTEKVAEKEIEKCNDYREIEICVGHVDSEELFFDVVYTGDLDIKAASWCTAKIPCNKVKLSLNICTFKKEKYICGNLQKIYDFFREHAGIREKISIFVVDNGGTLSQRDIGCPNTYLIPNKNLGGAGGFARGVIEISEKAPDTTHILLMDDDVGINCESIYVTIKLLEYMKDEYKNYFIGGDMFNIEHRNEKYAGIEWWDRKGNCVCSAGPRRMFNRFDALINDIESIHKDQYQAWWYCVVPTSIMNVHNLPYPLFFRQDDIDFSFRNGAKIIHMNGICVWHEPFYKKQLAFPFNLDIRNMLALSFTDNHLSEFKTLLKLVKIALKKICYFNYDYAHALLDSLEQVCEGPNFYKDSGNCQKALKLGLSRNEKFREITPECQDVNYFQDYFKVQETRLGFLKHIFFILTLNGHFLPNFMIKKGEGLDFYDDESNSNFFLREKIYVINRFSSTYATRIKSNKKCFKAVKRIIILLIKYILNRNRIKKEFIINYKTMTDISFWKKYLDI